MSEDQDPNSWLEDFHPDLQRLDEQAKAIVAEFEAQLKDSIRAIYSYGQQAADSRSRYKVKYLELNPHLNADNSMLHLLFQIIEAEAVKRAIARDAHKYTEAYLTLGWERSEIVDHSNFSSITNPLEAASSMSPSMGTEFVHKNIDASQVFIYEIIMNKEKDQDPRKIVATWQFVDVSGRFAENERDLTQDEVHALAQIAGAAEDAVVEAYNRAIEDLGNSGGVL